MRVHASSILILSTLILFGCAGSDTATTPGGDDPAFYFKYTLNGTNYSLVHGPTNNGDVPTAQYDDNGYAGASRLMMIPPSSNFLYLYAAMEGITNLNTIRNGVSICLYYTNGVLGPAYVSSYQIRTNGVAMFYKYAPVAVSFTLSAFGAVGSTVEGTFSGTVTNILAPGPSAAINGSFRLKRAVNM